MSWKLLCMTGLILPLLASTGAAHHSFAMFDDTVTLAADGTVVEFQWTNPHAWLEVEIPDPHGSGELQVWALELSAPPILAQRGWTPITLVPGEKVNVVFHPMRDGSPGGAFIQATKGGDDTIYL